MAPFCSCSRWGMNPSRSPTPPGKMAFFRGCLHLPAATVSLFPAPFSAGSPENTSGNASHGGVLRSPSYHPSPVGGSLSSSNSFPLTPGQAAHSGGHPAFSVLFPAAPGSSHSSFFPAPRVTLRPPGEFSPRHCPGTSPTLFPLRLPLNPFESAV